MNVNIPTMYVMNQGAGRLPLSEFDEELDLEVYYAGLLIGEAWDKCRGSVNCADIGGRRHVLVNVQCFRYIQ
jgi:hypothetical protein